MEGGESQRIVFLQEAVKYYSQMTMKQNSEILELKVRLAGFEGEETPFKEKDRQLRALKANLQQKEEEVSALKEDLDATGPSPENVSTQLAKKISPIKVMMEKTMVDSGDHWCQRWSSREQEVVEVGRWQEELRKNQAEAMAELTLKMSAMMQENEQKLDFLEKEKEAAATRALREKTALTEKTAAVEAKLREVQEEMNQKEADWRKKCQALTDQLKQLVAKKEEASELLEQAGHAEEVRVAMAEKWLEENEKTKQDINVLIDYIFVLYDLASKRHRENVKMKRAKIKAQREAVHARRKWTEEREDKEKEDRTKKNGSIATQCCEILQTLTTQTV